MYLFLKSKTCPLTFSVNALIKKMTDLYVCAAENSQLLRHQKVLKMTPAEFFFLFHHYFWKHLVTRKPQQPFEVVTFQLLDMPSTTLITIHFSSSADHVSSPLTSLVMWTQRRWWHVYENRALLLLLQSLWHRVWELCSQWSSYWLLKPISNTVSHFTALSYIHPLLRLWL